MKYVSIGVALGYIFFSPVYAATADHRDFCEDTTITDIAYEMCVKEQKVAKIFLKQQFKELLLARTKNSTKTDAYRKYFSCKAANTDNEKLLDRVGWKRCIQRN